MTGSVTLELPYLTSDGPRALPLTFPDEAHAKRALRRGAYRAAAKALREKLGYPGAALALESFADSLLECSEDHGAEDSDKTIVDLPVMSVP